MREHKNHKFYYFGGTEEIMRLTSEFSIDIVLAGLHLKHKTLRSLLVVRMVYDFSKLFVSFSSEDIVSNAIDMSIDEVCSKDFCKHLQNCERRLLASSCLSVRLHGTTRLPLDGFS
jgi:hypothetical protein